MTVFSKLFFKPWDCLSWQQERGMMKTEQMRGAQKAVSESDCWGMNGGLRRGSRCLIGLSVASTKSSKQISNDRPLTERGAESTAVSYQGLEYCFFRGVWEGGSIVCCWTPIILWSGILEETLLRLSGGKLLGGRCCEEILDRAAVRPKVVVDTILS